MAESIKIVAQTRGETGSAAAGRLRQSGVIPAVLCKKGSKSVSVQIDEHDFDIILNKHGRENLIADVEIDGKKPVKAMLKELQIDPVHSALLHADFVEISMTEKMRVKISIELVGEPAGVTQEGGILDHVLREVEVECLPTDLVESIPISVESLGIGDGIYVRDLELSDTLAILTPEDTAIASVSAPREEEEEVVEEGEALEEGAEPEVITERKEGDEGEKDESGEDKGAKSGQEKRN